MKIQKLEVRNIILILIRIKKKVIQNEMLMAIRRSCKIQGLVVKIPKNQPSVTRKRYKKDVRRRDYEWLLNKNKHNIEEP